MSIILLEDYKSYAGLNSPNKDEALQYLVDYVNTFIVNYCNTNFEPNVVVGAKVTSDNGYDFLVPNVPVISVEEVRYKGEVVDAENYLVDKEMGLVESLTTFGTDRFGFEIDYTHGHATTPPDLIVSAMEWITYLSKREFNNARSIGNGETADYGDTELLPTHIRVAMNLYKVL